VNLGSGDPCRNDDGAMFIAKVQVICDLAIECDDGI